VKSEELVDDSESDTESVCSTLSASSSVASSSDKAKVRVTFPPFITTKQLYRHFCSYGYDETEIHIQRHINRRTGKPCGSATVIVSSQPGMFISHLNDSLIFKLHKLKAEPYMEGRRQERRQKRSSKQPKVSTTSPDTFHSTRSSSDPCRVFVGSGLPTYINEQHIREHFQQLAREIIRVDTIKDKITQIPKGYFFITFKSQASADMAIQMFHKSFLFGDYRVKVERQRSAQPCAQSSGLVEAPCSPNTDSYSAVQATSLVVDNLNPAITDDEIKALISVPFVAVINDEDNPQRRYIQFYSYNDAITAQDRLNGKSFLGQTIQAAINKEVQTPSSNVVSQHQHRQDLQHPEQQYPYCTVPQTYQYDPQQHGHTVSPEQFQQRK
jgi:RNA recognition motif-containing protein